jgi:5'-nucleotidase
MKVLLTNDDGISAPSMYLLKEVISEIAECIVVAPDSQRSASAHSISIIRDVSVREYLVNGALFGFQVDGTPADCVKIALSEILRDDPPDLIISGINQGPNTGVSVYYSGTVSAAREGTIAGIPAVAASLCSVTSTDFAYSAQIVRDLALKIFEQGLPKHITLNVNVPACEAPAIKGIKVTKQAQSRFIEKYIERASKNGSKIYGLAGELEVIDSDLENDEQAVKDGYVSITPLKLDLTDFSVMADMKEFLTYK